jgi:hypothetical protein
MTEYEFAEALRRELGRRGLRFNPVDVHRFVAEEWEVIRQDQDPWAWGHRFLIRNYPKTDAE